MATTRPRVPQGDEAIPAGKTLISYEEAVHTLTDLETVKAMVATINALLIEKGYYSAEEFRFQFRQSASKQIKKRKS